MITSNRTINNSAKRLFGFGARLKEEIKRRTSSQDFEDLKLSVTGKAKVRKFLKESSQNPKKCFQRSHYYRTTTKWVQNYSRTT